jgi:two-component system, sensor histidine kinase PdtaS
MTDETRLEQLRDKNQDLQQRLKEAENTLRVIDGAIAARKPEDTMHDAAAFEKLRDELRELRNKHEEAEQTLRAIGNGEVDAFAVSGPNGSQIYTLKGAEWPYRILVEAMSEGAATLTEDGIIVYCNAGLAAMLGLPIEKLLGTSLKEYVAEEDRATFQDLLPSCLLSRERKELCLERVDGERRYVLFSCGLHHSSEQSIGVVFTDISEIKKTEIELKDEKTLLSEILHRVKNTLAQISALAKIEASWADEPKVKEALEGLGGRISALAKLYTMLHPGSRPNSASLDIYLTEIAWALVSAVQAKRGQVELALKMAPIVVHPRDASPLGLILNELITNAFKYSFKDGLKGELQISLEDLGDKVLLEVANNGTALPKDFEPGRSSGLGLTLVNDLAHQLGGDFAWQGGKLTKFSVSFSKAKAILSS